MAHDLAIGTRIDDIFQWAMPVEGYNHCVSGKTRNGKTLVTTIKIVQMLERGEIVYANWKIDFHGYDERQDWKVVLTRTIFKNRVFFVYKKENFVYMDPIGLITGRSEHNIHFLNRLAGVTVVIDEGQWLLPSIDKSWNEETMARMKLVLHGGHYCRSLWIITQREQNISKNTRSQIHIWHRAVKRFNAFGWMLFEFWTTEDMKDDLPVWFEKDPETGDEKPIGHCERFWVNKKHNRYLKMYNTHAMRAVDAIEPAVEAEVYSTTFIDRLKLLARLFKPFRAMIDRNGLKPSYKLMVDSENFDFKVPFNKNNEVD